ERLGQHGFGFFAVMSVDLGHALEPDNDGIAALALFGESSGELRQLRELLHFVKYEPAAFGVWVGFTEELENREVEPQTLQRAKGIDGLGSGGDEDPAFPFAAPFAGSEALAAVRMRGHHAEGSPGFIEGAENTSALGRGVYRQGVGVFGIGDTFV